jgi:hypothetical protein
MTLGRLRLVPNTPLTNTLPKKSIDRQGLMLLPVYCIYGIGTVYAKCRIVESYIANLNEDEMGWSSGKHCQDDFDLENVPDFLFRRLSRSR